MVVLEPEEEVRAVSHEKNMNTKNSGEEPVAQRVARNPALTEQTPSRLGIPKRRLSARREELTTPDLVVLSLLAERPMHGYQADMELERREIRDWAAVSRPQVYYSVEKLTRAGLLHKLENQEAGAGPERDTFETTDKGRAALADALEREEWTTQRDRPAFLTWLALSWQARPGVFRKQLRKRRKFLHEELEREKKTLLSIYEEVGHKFHEAAWMVQLVIAQLRTEILWNKRLDRDLKRRAVALYPFSEGLPK